MRGAQGGVLDAINNKDEKVASVVATLRGPSGNGQHLRDRLDDACFLVWPQRKAKPPQKESTLNIIKDFAARIAKATIVR